MADCCTPKNSNTPQKKACPHCGATSYAVASQTVLLHIQNPWKYQLANNYYYCPQPDCTLAYFAEDAPDILQSAMRSNLRSKNFHDTVCYCYEVRQAQTHDPAIKAFVVAQTKHNACACHSRNPSGRCCLPAFPK